MDFPYARNLRGINAAIAESADGVNDIAAKTTDAAGKTVDNEQLVEKMKNRL